ncbi:MAG: LEA type 2 family protein [Desulfobacteraceae bacterium]|nr:LEA type 2 family protein [Desulfobacteraceae bacterium]
MEKNKLRTIVFLLLLVCLPVSCATLGNRQEPPRISLASIRVKEFRGLETAFDVDLRVLNRSAQSLTISGIDCDLSLNGRPFAQGVAGPQMEIGPYSGDTITLTLYSSVLDMITTVHRLIRGAGQETPDEKWTYAIKGHLQLGGSGLLNRVPINEKGEIDLRSLTESKN